VIAQRLFSYRQLSRLRKSATAAGLSHKSCTVSCDVMLVISQLTGMRWSGIQAKCPDQRSWAWISMAMPLIRHLHLLSASVFGIRSCHLTCAILRRQCRWKWSSLTIWDDRASMSQSHPIMRTGLLLCTLPPSSPTGYHALSIDVAGAYQKLCLLWQGEL